jgi:hypothetical protein
MGLEGRGEGSSNGSKLAQAQGSDSETAASNGHSKAGGRARRERLEADLARLEATNQVSTSTGTVLNICSLLAFHLSNGSVSGKS